MAHTQISITGYLVGNIWMSNAECWKHLSYDVTDQSHRWGEKGTLRDHVLAATNDGDFQSCVVAQGEIVITRTSRNATGTKALIRRFPLAMFPSVADMLHEDPDWFPMSDDGD